MIGGSSRTRVDPVRLEPLPEVLAWAISAGEDGRNTAALVEAVVQDPALALRALALPRGDLPGERGRLDLRQIAQSLGGGALHALVTRAATDWLRGLSAWSGKVELSAFWLHSVHSAHLAKALAAACGYPHPEEAYLAGLVHDAGLAAQMADSPDRVSPLFDGALSETHLLGRELEALGVQHPEVGEALVARLGLPAPVCDAVLLQHAAEGDLAGTHALVRILWVAEALADPSGSIAERERFGRLLGVDAARVARACESALAHTQASARTFGIASAARAGLWALPPLAEAPAAANASRSRPREALLDAILERAPLQQVPLQLLDTDQSRDILARTRAVVAAVFGLKDIAVFFYDSGKNELSGWLVDGEQLADAELRIPVNGSASTVARAWAERAVVVSVPGDDQALKGVDLQIARLLHSDGMITAPLVAGPTALGVIVLGVGGGQAARMVHERRVLARLADLVALALARGRDAAERQRSRQSEAIDRLSTTVRGLVHEARNPLSILKTQLELVRERVRGGAQVDRDVQILREEIDRVGGILSRLASMDTQVEPSRGTVNVNRTIQDLLALYREPLFAERGIAVKTDLAPQAPEVTADADALKQVLVNLWKNASEAMERGGQLRIATSDRVNYEGRLMVEIAISDTGPGMVPDTLEGVFTQRAMRAQETERGYGLANSYAIVRQLGGHIMCRSQPGLGTTFTLLLARAARAAPEAE
jgi:signal transduction histidine kinase/HD-like signal output (HDOD) protein